jgi:hypothetical protein
MSAPERIWLQDAGNYDAASDGEVTWCATPQDDDDTEYILAAPAVLAALPEVQALIGAAFLSAEIAVGSVDPANEDDATSQQIAEIEAIRLLTPADALTALAARDARMRAEGMERAAEIADKSQDSFWGPNIAAAIRAAKEGGGE